MKLEFIVINSFTRFPLFKLIPFHIYVTYLTIQTLWDKSSTFKEVNAVTKSVPSSGKSFLTNTELIPPVLIMEILIFNSKESMSTTTKPQEEDMSQEPSSWISNQEPWTQLELDPSVNSSDQITSSSVKLEPETTGLRATTLKELNSLTQFSMLPEKKLKDVIVFKDSRSLTLWEEEQDPVWEPSSFQKSEKNIPIESCKLSQLSHPQKSQIPLLNHTMLPSQSISWSKTPMSAWSLTTKPSMISASELLNSPPQPMVTWTIWSLLPCQVSPAASDSQVNLTLISENWLLTWSHSQDSTSSWSVSPHSPQEDPNNTELLQSQNSPNKCLMPRTWCVPLIQDTEDIWQHLPSSEEECQQKKLMNKCLTSKTRTHLTLCNGSPTTSSHPSVISHQRDWRWLSPSSETQLPSKRCSRELLNNSQLCLEEKLSSIGTPVKVWTRCNSLKPNPTWTTWSLNINNIKMPQPKKKENSKRKTVDDFIIIYLHNSSFLSYIPSYVPSYNINQLMLSFPYRIESLIPFSASTTKIIFQFNFLCSTGNSYLPICSSAKNTGKSQGDVEPLLQNIVCPSVIFPFLSNHQSVFSYY